MKISVESVVKQTYIFKTKRDSRYATIYKTVFFFVIFMIIFNISATARIRFDSTKIQIIRNYKTDNADIIFQQLFGKSNDYLFGELRNLAKKLDVDQKNYDSSKFPVEKLIKEIKSGNTRVDIGNEFMNNIIKYNNRLDYYDLYIKLAKTKGYIVTDYYSYLTKYKHSRKKILILRHDIDFEDEATRYMLEIEKRNNVKATYYFRWKTLDKALIQEIADNGFEVGLHYETIATYCIKNNNYDLTQNDIMECREILKNEVKNFKAQTGIDIKTIASHGNPVNKIIGIPNYVLLEDEKESDFGIIGETYDENILRNYISSYICDEDITKNNGFLYSDNPINSIMKKRKVIEFLTHPNHWNYDCYKRTKLYLDLLYGIKFD